MGVFHRVRPQSLHARWPNVMAKSRHRQNHVAGLQVEVRMYAVDAATTRRTMCMCEHVHGGGWQCVGGDGVVHRGAQVTMVLELGFRLGLVVGLAALFKVFVKLNIRLFVGEARQRSLWRDRQTFTVALLR